MAADAGGDGRAGRAGLPRSGRSLDQDAAVVLCRQYVASQSRAERRQLLAQLADYQGELDPVLRRWPRRPIGWSRAAIFPRNISPRPSCAGAMPDDLLYFVVPASYRPDRPTGLIVFMHGGRRSTSRRAPQATLRFPDADTPPNSNRSGDLFAATGMITVGPSAPWNDQSNARWCLREADDYLADVILECKHRFNIDADRVFLHGPFDGRVRRRTTTSSASPIASPPWWSAPAPGGWAIGRRFAARPVHHSGRARRPARRPLALHRRRSTADGPTRSSAARSSTTCTWSTTGSTGSASAGRRWPSSSTLPARLRRDPYYPHVALASPAGFRRVVLLSGRPQPLADA